MMPVSLTYDDLVRLIRVSVGVALFAAVGTDTNNQQV